MNSRILNILLKPIHQLLFRSKKSAIKRLNFNVFGVLCSTFWILCSVLFCIFSRFYNLILCFFFLTVIRLLAHSQICMFVSIQLNHRFNRNVFGFVCRSLANERNISYLKTHWNYCGFSKHLRKILYYVSYLSVFACWACAFLVSFVCCSFLVQNSNSFSVHLNIEHKAQGIKHMLLRYTIKTRFKCFSLFWARMICYIEDGPKRK